MVATRDPAVNIFSDRNLYKLQPRGLNVQYPVFVTFSQ